MKQLDSQKRLRKQTQLEFTIRAHGGRRKGAGRPNRSGHQAHVKRPEFKKNTPGHVTLRVIKGLPSLRKPEIFELFRRGVEQARKLGFGVVHFNILSNHVHLILEPGEIETHKILQSLCISFSKRLNAKLNRRGRVFEQRYHLHVLKTPTEVKRALAYVLTNDSRHFDQRNGIVRRPIVLLDQFSSADRFRGWKVLFKTRVDFVSGGWPDEWLQEWYRDLLIEPKTWLMKEGWKRAV